MLFPIHLILTPLIRAEDELFSSHVITSSPKKACMACRVSLNELTVMLRSVEFVTPTSE